MVPVSIMSLLPMIGGVEYYTYFLANFSPYIIVQVQVSCDIALGLHHTCFNHKSSSHDWRLAIEKRCHILLSVVATSQCHAVMLNDTITECFIRVPHSSKIKPGYTIQ